ncbi:MAG: dienelactone hydrolase family protein [Gammaproteobacteria bacterium]|jgi:carboxymethylenebutenolidase|nr:dienelactone hydrolase family protein [Gammaproteobacteria bacterium]MBT4492460.1 dienelactone hydrolase family protein [Gammaproteobacteria bacterium]MBT7369657.1 dienelactone hydrolase family protein [Gammaproteobacteria bacterium]
MIIRTLLLMVLVSGAHAEIKINPTPADEIPAAITGEAGPLQGEDLYYYSDNPKTRGYLAVPEGDEPKGAIILIHEWNGLTQRVREATDAFAAEGYVALAADLYQGRTGTNRDENMVLVRESLANMPEIITNLEAAASYLKERPDVNGKVAAIGWCYGGGVALSYALGSENHEGTAIFYGRLVDDPEKLKHLHHEILGTFARLDRGPSPEQVDGFAKALRAAGIENDLHIYDDVRHGFWLHVERDQLNSEGPALHAWNRLRAYLKRTIGS